MKENEAIKRVEEFGMYHAIGDLPNSALTVKAFETAIEALQEIQQYRAIGTFEECREARERKRGKKPIKDEYNHECCPNCGWVVYKDEWGGRYLPHCENCGQAISWESDTP